MALTLEVTSRSQRDQLGDSYVRTFGREGGTIGRAGDNDWRLPDAERYISSHHATIDFQAGSYYLIDTSTNGVYVNGSDVPVGAGKPQRLFDGDTLRMGEYVISVAIDEGFDLIAEDEDHRSSIAREELVTADDDSSEFAMLDAEEITGAQELRSRLFGETVTDTFVPEQPKKSPRKAKVTPMRNTAAADSRASAKSAKAGEAELPADPAAAFLRGLGIDESDVSRVDTRRLMHNAGLALREFVLGTMELLQNRAAVKNTFRLEQTTIQPGANNPLKFSASADDAIRNLLSGGGAEFGPAVDSVREVCRDIKQHEIAIVCAMREAFKDFADRFDPEELQQRFDGTLKRGSLFSGNTKAKYWDLYGDLYQVMTQRPEGQFPQLFGEEFSRAYGEHLDRLRRDASLKQASEKKGPDGGKPRQAEG